MRQLEMFPRKQPDRLAARLAAKDQIRRSRKEQRRIVEVRCPACGERVVVTP